MGRPLIRLADGSGFTLGGIRLEKGTLLELQVEGDRWLPGTFAWSEKVDTLVLFTICLGGPHERDGAIAPEVLIPLDIAEAYFRFPPARVN